MKPFPTGSLNKPDIGRLFAFAPTLIRGNGRRCFYGLSLPMKDACGHRRVSPQKAEAGPGQRNVG